MANWDAILFDEDERENEIDRAIRVGMGETVPNPHYKVAEPETAPAAAADPSGAHLVALERMMRDPNADPVKLRELAHQSVGGKPSITSEQAAEFERARRVRVAEEPRAEVAENLAAPKRGPRLAPAPTAPEPDPRGFPQAQAARPEDPVASASREADARTRKAAVVGLLTQLFGGKLLGKGWTGAGTAGLAATQAAARKNEAAMRRATDKADREERATRRSEDLAREYARNKYDHDWRVFEHEEARRKEGAAAKEGQRQAERAQLVRQYDGYLARQVSGGMSIDDAIDSLPEDRREFAQANLPSMSTTTALLKEQQKIGGRKELEGVRVEGRKELEAARAENRAALEAQRAANRERLKTLARAARRGGNGGGGDKSTLVDFYAQSQVESALQRSDRPLTDAETAQIHEQARAVGAAMRTKDLQMFARQTGYFSVRAGDNRVKQDRKNERDDRQKFWKEYGKQYAGVHHALTSVEQTMRGMDDQDIYLAMQAVNSPGRVAALQRVNPKAAALSQRLTGVKNRVLKIRSGAAVTTPEFERLSAEFGDGGGLWASPATLRRGIADASSAMGAEVGALRKAYDQPEPGAANQPATGGGQTVRVRWKGAVKEIPADKLDAALSAGAERI